jgi:hypothetical protein
MAFTLTIGGLDVIAADYLDVGRGTPATDCTLQARSLFRCTVKDRTGAYRPVLRQEVIAELDGVRVFGGSINRIQERDWGDYVGIWCDLECADFASQCDGAIWNGVADGPTLKDLVGQVLALTLPGYTVHPAMAPGPTLGPQGWGFRYVTEVFDDLSSISGWPWKCDYYKQVLFAAPGTAMSPFSLLADNDTINAIEVEHGFEGYVNKLWVQYGSGGPRETTDVWHGDSSTRLFPVSFPQPIGIVTQPGSANLNGVDLPVGVWQVDTGLQFYWRASDAALIQDFSLPVLTPTDTLTATYVANYPGAVYAVEEPGFSNYGEFGLLETAPDVFDVKQAQQLCEGRLREKGGPLRRIRAVTHRPGLEPGQTCPVNVPERAIDENCLILGVNMTHDGRKGDGSDYWKFDVDLVEGAAYRETWQKFWGLAGPSSGIGQSASGSVGPPPSGGGGGGGGGGGTTVSGAVPVYLGGDREVGFTGSTGWVPIPGFVDELLGSATATAQTYTLRCQAWLSHWATGVTLQVRVVALVSGGVQVGISAVTTATDPLAAGAFLEFPFTTQAGAAQYYRVELQLNTAAYHGFVAGALAYPPVS